MRSLGQPAYNHGAPLETDDVDTAEGYQDSVGQGGGPVQHA